MWPGHSSTTTHETWDSDKEEATRGRTRAREPSPQVRRAVRESGIEDRREARHPMPVGRCVEDDEERHDARDRQAEPLAREPSAEANLRVEAAHRLFGRGDLRLGLDDEGRVRRRVDGKQVDRSSLAVVIERDLDRCRPAARLERARNGSHRRCVPLVEQSVERAPAVANDEVDVGLERGEDPADRPDREAIAVAPLHLRHERLRNAGGSRHVDLPLSSRPSDGSERATKPERIHVRIIPGAAYSALTRQRPSPDDRAGHGPASAVVVAASRRWELGGFARGYRPRGRAASSLSVM